MGEKSVRRIRNNPEFEDFTVADVERFSSQTIYAVAILGIPLFKYYIYSSNMYAAG